MSRGKYLCEEGVEAKGKGPRMEGHGVCREWVICAALGMRIWKHIDLGL